MSTNTKHTPGPWKLGNMADGSARRIEHRHGLIAISEHTNNANLIAAAPDLLAALEAALPMIDAYKAHSATVCGQIRAAIAKATGADK